MLEVERALERHHDPPVSQQGAGWTRSIESGSLRRVYVAVLGVLLVPAIWPLNELAPRPGLDNSWQGALQLALEKNLVFGRDFVFTYGPLGFLSTSTHYGDVTAALALVTSLMLVTAFVIAITDRVESLVGPVLAPIVAYLVAWAALGPLLAIVNTTVLMSLGGALVGYASLRSRSRAFVELSVLALGVLTVFGFLVKASTGLLLFAVTAVVAIGAGSLERWSPTSAVRRVGLLVVVTSASMVVAWLLLGQPLDAIGDYLRYSMDLAAGYGDAMAYEDPGRSWEYPMAAFVLLGMGSLVWIHAQDLPRHRRAASAVLWAGVGYAAFLHGFSRHDMHSTVFFGQMALLAVFFMKRAQLALGLSSLVLVLVTNVATSGLPPSDVARPQVRMAAFVHEVSATAMIDEASIERGRAQLREEYRLSASTIRLLEGHTVHVEPWEINLAFAYPEIEWRGTPVIQSYSAYTEDLDQLNADFIRSPHAPEFILRQNIAIDGRNPRFESPGYVAAVVCNYTEVAIDGGWQVLRRIPDRCDEPVFVTEFRTELGEAARIPQQVGRSVTLVRFLEVDRSLPGRLKGAIFKSTPLSIRLQDPGRSTGVHRLIEGTSEQPHVFALPECLRFSNSHFDTSTYSDLRLGVDSPAGRGGTYTLRVERLPVRC